MPLVILATNMVGEVNRNFFEFDVVTVDATGQEIRRERGRAEFFTEDLGNGVGLEMVAIPGGEFLMGTHPQEIQRRIARIAIVQSIREDFWLGQLFNAINIDQIFTELEQFFGFETDNSHHVTVPSFFMSKFPITQAQWSAVAALPKVNIDLKHDPSHFKGSNRPVECVSWEEAVEFCARLSQKTGKSYRLPSEAEWEYACRAGTITEYHFGETITTDLANYNGNIDEMALYRPEQHGVYRRQTTPVGSFQVANAFGLYDMHGNVSEWCQDNWHWNYKGAPTDGSAWLEETNDNAPWCFLMDSVVNSRYRVRRGGAWKSYSFGILSSHRDWMNPDNRQNFIGFRVALSQ